MTDLTALVANAGPNDVEYEDPHLHGRVITLRSARPRNFTRQTPVLFVHHGVLRNGGDYRNFWLPLVDDADVLVIAPEFSTEYFPGAAWYNLGNTTDAHGKPNPRDHWTYGVDGRVFAALGAAGVTDRRTRGVWGHSAGGQFVHRMISLGFTEGLAAAVTANAGTYAMPDLETAFPFGLGGMGLSEFDLRQVLAFPLTIMAGTEDIVTEDEHFPKEPDAMAQGGTRYERAHTYHDTGEQAARLLTAPFNWSIVDVPGVDHDGERMSAAAAARISTLLHARKN
jgi:poly(3-hydroxybutyrate) depolymerase